jgi:methoxymalonate biosynthesis acyl carrier protein
MTSSTDVSARLHAFIRERFGIPSDDADFNDDLNLYDYGYIDSFGAVELTSFIEDTFGVRFEDSDWTQHSLSSVNEISQFIERRRSKEA